MEKETRKNKSNSEDQKFLNPNQASAQDDSSLREISLVVERYSTHTGDGIDGESTKHLAFENESTFLLATYAGTLKLIKEKNEIFSGKMHRANGGRIDNIAYARQLGSFFLLGSGHLFRKDIDDYPAYHYMDMPSVTYAQVMYLRYSGIHRRLIGVTQTKLRFIDLDQKRVDLMFSHSISGILIDFVLFGKREDKVLSFNHKGQISFLIFNLELRKLLSSKRYQIGMIESRGESLSAIAVSDKNDHVLASIEGNFPRCSRTMIFEIKDNFLVQKAVIDHSKFAGLTKSQSALSCCGRFGQHIMWVGLERGAGGRAHMYDYNVDTGDLEHLEDKSVDHQAEWVMKMVRQGDNFFYASEDGRVMKLRLKC